MLPHGEVGWTARLTRNLSLARSLAHGDYSAARPDGAAIRTSPRLDCQAGRPSLPRYVITWSGHLQACVQGWPSRNRGVFPAVDHDRSRT
jgi:hypothetical protein